MVFLLDVLCFNIFNMFHSHKWGVRTNSIQRIGWQIIQPVPKTTHRIMTWAEYPDFQKVNARVQDDFLPISQILKSRAVMCCLCWRFFQWQKMPSVHRCSPSDVCLRSTSVAKQSPQMAPGHVMPPCDAPGQQELPQSYLHLAEDIAIKWAKRIAKRSIYLFYPIYPIYLSDHGAFGLEELNHWASWYQEFGPSMFKQSNNGAASTTSATRNRVSCNDALCCWQNLPHHTSTFSAVHFLKSNQLDEVSHKWIHSNRVWYV